MVQTLSEVRLEPKVITLTELCEQLGIPIVVRPWWGSVRWGTWHRDGHKHRGRWLCPGYATIKAPEVQSGVVVMWEGPCREHYGRRKHSHRQSTDVIDVQEHSLLVRVSQANYGSHFLIGMDDGHPFVTRVPKRLTTVQDAFDWLVPNIVREALTLGRDVKRQGDWFFIPYGRSVPKTRVRRWPRRPGRSHFLSLVSSTAYSHAPLIHDYRAVTRHIGDRVIFRSYPHPLVRGTVTAPNHPPIHLKFWHIAVRTRRTPAGDGSRRIIVDD